MESNDNIINSTLSKSLNMIAQSSLTIEESLTHKFGLSEIFYSIQGEGTRAGERCVFVRMQGCKLRCVWCDTPYALDHRKPELTLNGKEIEDAVSEYGCRFIEFTGGEPLEQPDLLPLFAHLCDLGYTVAIETGGHVNATNVDPRVIRIIDMKAPGSKMVSLNDYSNLENLRPTDEIKFVLSDRRDYDWAKELVSRYDLSTHCAAVLFSVVFGRLEPLELVTWILEDKLDVRYQYQLHKIVWEPSKRGV